MKGNKLRIIDVDKKFNDHNQEVRALDRINLNIDEGDFYCILGPSGCGKTTLLRCIAGFEQPSEGQILLGEEAVKNPGPDRTMVFQDFDQLLPWKTVLENVEYPLKVNDIADKDQRAKIAQHFISIVGLTEFANNFPHQLSGGMKQRVAIARALALNPKVLLMDEPFASLDAQTRRILQAELIRIWEQVQTTVVFITHNIQEAIILGTKIAVMTKRPGRIKKVIQNDLPRPRAIGSEGFSEMWTEINDLLEFNLEG